jgi:serine/threonine-protein kinase RsbT
VEVVIREQVDVERARRATRTLAAALGLNLPDAESTVLAASELATNLVRYAPGGTLTVRQATHASLVGLELVSEDHGPGIPNLALAMQDGVGAVGSMGSGLPGVKRLMDELEIQSSADGTSIVARKWLRRG